MSMLQGLALQIYATHPGLSRVMEGLKTGVLQQQIVHTIHQCNQSCTYQTLKEWHMCRCCCGEQRMLQMRSRLTCHWSHRPTWR